MQCMLQRKWAAWEQVARVLRAFLDGAAAMRTAAGTHLHRGLE